MKLLRLLATTAAQLASTQPTQQAPAASMDGGAFYNAALRAGLDTEAGTLNEIVDLVNKGHTPDQAAQAVKSRKGPGRIASGLLQPPAMTGGLLSTHMPSHRGLLSEVRVEPDTL